MKTIKFIYRQYNHMDSTDLPHDALHSIFIQPANLSQDAINSIVEWNQILDPSFGMVKNQINKFFKQDDQQNSVKACKDVLSTIKMLAERKCPRNFMRGYLANVKAIFNNPQSLAHKIVTEKADFYREKWQQAPIQVLQLYFDTFDLKNKVPPQEVDGFIEDLIVSKKYNQCLDFIKFLGIKHNKQNIQKLVGKMSNKKDASKAADYVKKLQLNPKDYPQLGERLYKNTARHFLTKHGWQYAEQIFEENPQALACIVEDLIYKKSIEQARSIWSRHNLWDYLQKQESRIFFKEDEKLGNKEDLKNFLFDDKFGPNNSQKYFSLVDFGFEQKDVVWVDKTSENLPQILLDIQSAQMLGIDTESIVGQTKFQKTDQAAIIQISTLKRIYIFDGFNSYNPKIADTIQNAFCNQIIVGHSFTNDTEGIIKAFGIKNKDVSIKNLIDICKVYKCLNPQGRYSSLAHICKQVLGKQLSKQQTLTNWKRRPLRKNQLHYAALDAEIVLQIYKKWIKQYGQMVHYYADISYDSL